VNLIDVDKATYDLSVKNPNKKDEVIPRSPTEILEEMQALDEESAALLETIKGLI
jgi:type I restriction enzyme M protein